LRSLHRRDLDSVPADADARNDDDELMLGRPFARIQSRRFSIIGCCILALCGARQLLADGGVIQFRKQAGPFLVTLFSTPAPLHAGPADLSVLVESAKDGQALLDAKVILRLHPSSEHDPSKVLKIEATRAQATNKLLYAALPSLTGQGLWDVRIDVEEGPLSASAYGAIQVLAPRPALLTDWPYFALIPVCIGLFVLNQYLRRRHLARVRAMRR
jgi:hypothetical protein